VKREELVRLYYQDSIIKTISENLDASVNKCAQLKGLSGSLPSIVISTTFLLRKQSFFIVMTDKEEAAYFYNDIKELLPEAKVLFFPASYRKPYQYEEIDNANVLLRSEVLTHLNQEAAEPALVISYSDALT